MSAKPMRLWDEDLREAPPHPEVEASDQIAQAIIDMERHPDLFLRWPWPLLDEMTGGMAPGQVWYVCAFSGVGKTTFMSSAINGWLDQGKKVCVLPLETKPNQFRTYLACQRLGIDPGDVFSGELRARNDPRLDALKAEVRGQIHIVDKLRVKGTAEINVETFRDACEEAADFEADVLILDHIDHVDGGDGSNLYAESVRVNKAAKRFVDKYGLLMVLTSQLNTEAVKGTDHLAKFQPPREQHVKFGGHKREIATGMLGIFRPVRRPKPGEDAEAFKLACRAARAGELEPKHILEPNTMGLVNMKSRNYGGREGNRIALRYDRGRILNPDTVGMSVERRYGI